MNFSLQFAADLPQIGDRVVDRDGQETGTVVGMGFGCRMEGCRGSRIPTRWPDGKRTYPCTKGMTSEGPGEWSIG